MWIGSSADRASPRVWSRTRKRERTAAAAAASAIPSRPLKSAARSKPAASRCGGNNTRLPHNDSPMRSPRLIFFLGLAAAIGIGVSLRLATRAQLTAGPRVRALGSDDDYHLRRARFALDHYPRTILFDALM